jgi:hypothetical protein
VGDHLINLGSQAMINVLKEQKPSRWPDTRRLIGHFGSRLVQATARFVWTDSLAGRLS